MNDVTYVNPVAAILVPKGLAIERFGMNPVGGPVDYSGSISMGAPIVSTKRLSRVRTHTEAGRMLAASGVRRDYRRRIKISDRPLTLKSEFSPVGGSLVDWYNNMMVDTETTALVSAKQQALLAKGGVKGNIDPLRAQELSAEAAFDPSNAVMFTGAVAPDELPSAGLYQGALEGARYELDLAKRGITAASGAVHDTLKFGVGSVFGAIPASVWLLGLVALAVYTYPTWGPTAGALAKRKIDRL